MLGSAVIIFSFLTVFIIFTIIFDYSDKKRNTIKFRLKRIEKQITSEKEDTQLNQPMFIRFIKPILDDMSKTILKVTPKEIVTVFERKVVMAGNPYNLSMKDWINLQITIILCFPLLTIAIGYYSGMDIRNGIFLSISEILLGIVLPILILNKKIVDRQREITNTLPDVIDLLTVSVEAGLGFDGALAKVVDKMPGPLAVEFGNVLQQIKVGKQKRDALRDMADRVMVSDLSTFIGSVIQADQFGVSIGNVLRIQSEQMRQNRKQRAQEKAMKAPVKILIPMVLFIFPTIFSVLIGPIIIKLMSVFTK